MSIGICGRIKLLNDNMNEHIELAYLIQKSAIDSRIGCKLGGNVSRCVFDMYSKNAKKSTILFEIMDSPLDNFVDNLFFPMIDSKLNNYEQEFDIKINSSLKIMYNFFRIILDNKAVECIYLDFNYLFKNDEETVDVKIDYLSKYILSMYIEEGYFTPVISMRIIR